MKTMSEQDDPKTMSFPRRRKELNGDLNVGRRKQSFTCGKSQVVYVCVVVGNHSILIRKGGIDLLVIHCFIT